jgi:hypothetical protein
VALHLLDARRQGGRFLFPEKGFEMHTIPDFLSVLASPTGWLALGALLSVAFANWKWYNQQSGWIKRGFPFLGSFLISAIAQVLLTYVPPSFWDILAPYFNIIAPTLWTWLGTQGWFQGVIKPNRVETFIIGSEKETA